MTGVDLSKRIEAAGVSLQKMAEKSTVDLGDVTAQITAEIDFSGSMDGLYRRGTVQEAVERALALSMTGLDDDGIVPVTFFHGDPFDTIQVAEKEDSATGVVSYSGLVDKFHQSHTMGGTRYSGAIEKALGGGKRKFLGRQTADDPDAPPFLHLFFTDGAPANSDKRKIEELLVAARTRPHFFQFIMLGTDRDALDYLDHLNNGLSGPGVDNVGVTIYKSPTEVADTEFFDAVVSEFFPIWLPAARTAGITKK